MPICRMCLKEKKLVDSHIIPRSFFEVLRTDERFLEIHSNKKGEFVKKSPIGIYDQIVCLECEKLFQTYDEYACKILLNSAENIQEIKNGEEHIASVIKNYDYNNLKLFFISVLWRASVSKNIYFEHVKLGPYEEIFCKMIINGNSDEEDIFPSVISKFKNESVGEKFILDPRPVRIDNIKFYSIYLGSGYKIFVKVDKQKMPEELEKISIKKSKPLYLVMDGFNNSREMDILIKLIKQKK